MNHIASNEVGARSIDVSRGESRGEVSAQWYARPDDQRFLSLDSLFHSVATRRDTAKTEMVTLGQLRLDAVPEDRDYLGIQTPGGLLVRPSHNSFGQLCDLAKAPAGYLRKMHARRAAMNLQADLIEAEEVPVQIYSDTATTTLRAATGPKYGRIYDADLVAAVQRFAGNGTGDTNWKVPGVIDWGTKTYNPYVDVTTETTTLFASDRDVFLFLVDDTHPIEIGKLANGDPDLIFRGFYAWNSEVGSRSLGFATFWLRAVCQNRNLWGVENFDEIRIRHSSNAPERFMRQAAPALQRYAASEPNKLLAGIRSAQDAKIGHDRDDRAKFLTEKADFSMKQALRILDIHEQEEGRPAESVWDMVQGITAVARRIPHQDQRLDVEKVAARLMDKSSRHIF